MMATQGSGCGQGTQGLGPATQGWRSALGWAAVGGVRRPLAHAALQALRHAAEVGDERQHVARVQTRAVVPARTGHTIIGSSQGLVYQSRVLCGPAEGNPGGGCIGYWGM